MEEKKLTGYPSIDKPWLKYYSEEAINTPCQSVQCTNFYGRNYSESRKEAPMTKRKPVLKALISDLKAGSSHSVDFLLKEDVQDCLSVAGIRVRRIFAPLLRLVYRTQTPYQIRIDRREPLPGSEKGRIFAINHRQGDDIVTGANVAGQSAYIVFGNKYLALDTTNGLGLWAYGMILLDRDNRANRRCTYDKMKYVLEQGGNIIIYPEGYWNLDDNGESDERHGADGHNSENWLIQDFNIGIFRLAQETGCEIVPTVLHYDEHKKKICYGRRGMPFAVHKDDDIFEKKEQLLTIMRTMYYGMMEKFSDYKRSDLESGGQTLSQQWEQLKRALVSDCDIPRTGYCLNLADEKRIGKAKVTKPVVTRTEAFAHLQHLKPRRENAFLFRKR